MSKSIFFITGTDTGVGKTVLSALLTQRLREKGVSAAGLKPLCSGDRDDARRLRRAASNALTLDEINPWHFRAALAPLLAARAEGKRVQLRQVTQHIQSLQKRFELLVVEGAGGLLSPLGENFNSRDCLLEWDAHPIVVCPNRLGAINQVLLVLGALPEKFARKSQIILMSPPRSNSIARQNFAALAEFVNPSQLHRFPWVPDFPDSKSAKVDQALDALISALLFQK